MDRCIFIWRIETNDKEDDDDDGDDDDENGEKNDEMGSYPSSVENNSDI